MRLFASAFPLWVAALFMLPSVQSWGWSQRAGGGGPGVSMASSDGGSPTLMTVQDLLLDGVAKHQAGLLEEAERMYREVLARNRHHPDALHLLGLLAHEMGNGRDGVQLIRRAITESEKAHQPNAAYYSNLGELLRSLASVDEAAHVLEEGLKRFPNFTSMAYNLAAVREEQGLPEQQEVLLEVVVTQQPDNAEAILRLASLTYKRGDYERSHELFQRASELGPDKKRALTGLGLCHFQQGHVQQALEIFEGILRQDPTDDNARLNVGAMLQADGRFDEALDLYNEWLARQPDNVAALNNKAAILLNSGREQMAAPIFERALALDPNCTECLINLASFYQEEGMLDLARQYYDTAYTLTGNVGLLIRNALMLAPVLPAGVNIDHVRATLESRVRGLLSRFPLGAGQGLGDPGTAVERIHFYMVYHGRASHDRLMQGLVSQLYLRAWPQVLLGMAPHCRPELPEPTAVATTNKPLHRVKVGFISRFFGAKEPHGLLLEGIMRHLPRSRFHVLALVIPTPNKPLSSEVMSAADELHVLSLHFVTARQQVAALGLDILIFGEMNSEPVNHFLGFSRSAPIQMLFWGNPITSGNPSVDYYISADAMEHPYRTNLTAEEEPYSEQVVLLDGQGIWYRRPALPSTWEPRSSYGQQQDWTVYMCAQSLFKMHPDMDAVFTSILRRDKQGHVVFLEGRRPRWTEAFRERLLAVGADMSRVHFMPRFDAGEKYLQLLNVADVVLHPFPFGGSRTSAEALYLGKAIVVLRNTSLRGRMAESFLRTMGLQDYVAADAEDYVALAIKLGRDRDFREDMEAKIRLRVDRIWDRLDVVYEWGRFLARVSGQPPLSPLEVGFSSLEAYERQLAHHPPIQQPSTTESSTRATAPADAGATALPEHQGSASAVVFQKLLQYASRLYGLGQAEAAIEVWREAIEIDDKDPKLLNDLGAALQEQWRLEEAQVLLRRAVEYGGQGYRLAMNNLAVTLHALDRKDEAIHWYTRSLEGKTWRDEGSELYVSNLGNLLRDQGRLLEAVQLYTRHLELPDPQQGGGLVALLALHQLGPRHYGPIGRLEKEMRRQGRLALPSGESLLSLVTRLQDGGHYLTINSMVIFLDWLNLLHPTALQLYEMITAPEPPPLIAEAVMRQTGLDDAFLSPSALEGVHVITGYYYHRHHHAGGAAEGETYSRRRQWELDLCLALNAANPYVQRLHLLLEETDEATSAVLVAHVNDLVGPEYASKVQYVRLGRRPTFSDALSYTTEHLSGRVCVLANADIFLDHSLARLYPPQAVDLDRRVLALLRWEVTSINETAVHAALDVMAAAAQKGQGAGAAVRPFHQLMGEGNGGEGGSFYSSVFHPRIDSQDAWVFRSPLPAGVIGEASFYLGRPRCDNRFARILLDHGLRVESPSMALRTHHLHQKQQHQRHRLEVEEEEARGGRLRAYSGEDQVNGELSSVLLTDQWIF